MKKLIIILVILLLISWSYELAYSQVFPLWVQNYNGEGNGDDIVTSMVTDKSGNVYVTGTSTNSQRSADEYATIKYSTTGVQRWVQRYSGLGAFQNFPSSISIDSSGNVYVTGSSWSGPPILNSYDYATIKYDSSGVELWTQRYSAGTEGGASSVVADISGNVYVTGRSIGGGTRFDYATIKYNSSGAQLWVKRYNGPGNNDDGANSIAVDNSGNVYVTGYSTGVGTEYDYATLKYNSVGTLQWIKRNDGGIATSIVKDGGGNVVITGNSGTIKYNPTGDSLWVRRFGAKVIAVDASNNVYVTGASGTTKYNSGGDSLWSSLYGGNSIVLDNLGYVYITAGSGNYSTLKFDSLGIMQWFQNWPGVSIAVDTLRNVYVSSSIYVLGSYYNYETVKNTQQQVKTLYLKTLIEGFYDNITNIMVSDTIQIYLRSLTPPYTISDSAKSVLATNGNGVFNFVNPANGTPYYIVVKHRNSIETWSKIGGIFSSNQLYYDFTTDATKAYGNNLKLKGSKYCIYSGDVNQSRFIDGSDLILIDNDILNSGAGYISTDLNGDFFIDGSDLSIGDNNASQYVGVIRP